MPTDRPQDDAAQTRQLAAELYPRLLRFFRSKVPHPDCHDLAQQTFTKFLRQLRSKRIDNPRGYLWGVAHFQLLKFIGRKRPGGERLNSTRMSMAFVGTSLSMHFDKRNRITAALRKLPLAQQLALGAAPRGGAATRGGRRGDGNVAGDGEAVPQERARFAARVARRERASRGAAGGCGVSGEFGGYPCSVVADINRSCSSRPERASSVSGSSDVLDIVIGPSSPSEVVESPCVVVVVSGVVVWTSGIVVVPVVPFSLPPCRAAPGPCSSAIRTGGAGG